uniref:(California timema) hypothetical protein n=1 Tax=Timema californicum TaxID=61474 RepID=A0A7R9P6V0_TIMCA|nr:unnamed protein product [Timema californicum]
MTTASHYWFALHAFARPDLDMWRRRAAQGRFGTGSDSDSLLRSRKLRLTAGGLVAMTTYAYIITPFPYGIGKELFQKDFQFVLSFACCCTRTDNIGVGAGADIGGSEIPCNLMALLHTMPTRQHYRDDYRLVGAMSAAPFTNTPISVLRAGCTQNLFFSGLGVVSSGDEANTTKETYSTCCLLATIPKTAYASQAPIAILSVCVQQPTPVSVLTTISAPAPTPIISIIILSTAEATLGLELLGLELLGLELLGLELLGLELLGLELLGLELLHSELLGLDLGLELLHLELLGLELLGLELLGLELLDLKLLGLALLDLKLLGLELLGLELLGSEQDTHQAECRQCEEMGCEGSQSSFRT